MKISVLIFFILLFQSLQAQQSCKDSVVFSGIQYSSPFGIYKKIQLNNGNYLLYEIRSSTYNNNNSTDYIVLTDSNGTAIKSLQLNITNTIHQRLNYAAAANDGGFVLAGDKHHYNGAANHDNDYQKVVIAKFDAACNLLWCKELTPIADPDNYNEKMPFAISAISIDNTTDNIYCSMLSGTNFGFSEQPVSDFYDVPNFIIHLSENGQLVWSNRFDLPFVTGTIGDLYRSSSILKLYDKLFIWGEVKNRNAVFSCEVNQLTGVPIKANLYEIAIQHTQRNNTGRYPYAVQNNVAFKLANNMQSVIFRESFTNTAGEKIINLINIVVNESGVVEKARRINRNIPVDYYQIPHRKTNEIAISPDNTIAIMDKERGANKFAVIDSNNTILLSKKLSTAFSPKPEINDLTFTKNGKALSLHIVDTSSTNRVQHLELSIDGTANNNSSCNPIDTGFITIDTAIIQTTNLPIYNTKPNLFTITDAGITITNYPFTPVPICKSISICDTIDIKGNQQVCTGINYTYLLYKNTNCSRAFDTSFIDNTKFKIVLLKNDTLVVRPLVTGQHYLYIGLKDCVLKDSVLLNVSNKAEPFSLGNDTSICSNQSVMLTAPQGFNYKWSNGATTQNITVKSAGNYIATISDNCGFTFSDTIRVNMYNTPDINLPNDTTICAYDEMVLQANNGFSNYVWNTGATTASIIVHNAGLYKLTATTADNCIAIDSVYIKTKDCKNQIWFPTAFTPNNDGLNDTYKPTVDGSLESYKLEIYNRYGQKIFSTQNHTVFWNGTFKGAAQPTGSYVFFCEYKFRGMEGRNEKGTITLIR